MTGGSGKFRYSVAIPTPERRAISAMEIELPPSANASRAVARIVSWFWRASARWGQVLALEGLGSRGVIETSPA